MYILFVYILFTYIFIIYVYIVKLKAHSLIGFNLLRLKAQLKMYAFFILTCLGDASCDVKPIKRRRLDFARL